MPSLSMKTTLRPPPAAIGVLVGSVAVHSTSLSVVMSTTVLMSTVVLMPVSVDVRIAISVAVAVAFATIAVGALGRAAATITTLSSNSALSAPSSA